MPQKPLKIVATRAVSENLSEQIPQLIVHLIAIFNEHTLDMYVIEKTNNQFQIRSAGYKNFNGELDEETILRKIDLQHRKTLWFKVDDYGAYYLGTLLYPEEY